jgi:molecular chaperone GrpE (heat shock protein)
MSALGFRIKNFLDTIDNLERASEDEKNMALELLGEAFLKSNKSLFETKDAMESAIIESGKKKISPETNIIPALASTMLH